MKIGMYTEDEIFNYMTNCEGSMLGRSMYDAVFGKLHALITENEQLKADYGNKAQVERDLLEEENKQLKEQLQQKENIINKANNYVIDNANIYLSFIGNKVGFFKENDGKTPIELLEILERSDNK